MPAFPHWRDSRAHTLFVRSISQLFLPILCGIWRVKDFCDRSPFGRCGREEHVTELACVRGLLDTGGGVGAWWLGVRAPRAFFVFPSIRRHGNWTGDRGRTTDGRQRMADDGGRRERWGFGNLIFEISDLRCATKERRGRETESSSSTDYTD